MGHGDLLDDAAQPLTYEGNLMDKDIEALADAHGGYWGEHPDYSVSCWKWAVTNEDTRLGYWEWVENQLANED